MSATLNGSSLFDEYGLPADWEGEGMPEEWEDSGHPLALALGALNATPGIGGEQRDRFARELASMLRQYASGDLVVHW